MKIFLDTNVILTGAFNPYGPASQLKSIIEHVRFVVSDYVLKECYWNAKRCSPNKIIEECAIYLINEFLNHLNVIEVNNINSSGYICSDKNDQQIFDAAYMNKCDCISTYNFPDFPSSTMSIQSPLSILHTFQTGKVDHYVQYPLLSNKGTLLFFGTLHHKSSMGNILYSKGALTVLADKNGYIELKGKSVKSVRALAPLEGGKEFAMVIRYNSSNFEASRWVYKEKWEKEILTTATCKFDENTKVALFFENKHQFFGQVQNLSGMPRYIKDKKTPFILANKSIEAVTGSIDLKYILYNSKVDKTNNGYKIILPSHQVI